MNTNLYFKIVYKTVEDMLIGIASLSVLIILSPPCVAARNDARSFIIQRHWTCVYCKEVFT